MGIHMFIHMGECFYSIYTHKYKVNQIFHTYKTNHELNPQKIFMILKEHTIGCQQHRHQPHFTSRDQLHGLYNIIGHN